MKFETLKTSDRRISPLIQVKSSCGCSDPANNTISEKGALTPHYISGYISIGAESIPVVSTKLSARDKWETVKARISSFRMHYSVKPGLYAAGEPDDSSDVIVTSNYKMSFDAVRSSLQGMNVWILVLDTKGINVWCAAGKGTFGTSELLNRLSRVRLGEVVTHKKIIVPQLGAPGIDSGEVRRKSGFSVLYGPVRSEDLKKYIADGYKCNDDMRRVRFDIIDRLILTPIELRQILLKFHYFALFTVIFFGLTPEGIIFRDSIYKGYIFIFAGLLSVFAGAFFTPVFLPFIPFRSFALKGWVAGSAFFAGVLYLTGAAATHNTFLVLSVMVLFPLLSSYLALQFTGATTFTSLSGVKKEIKLAFPVYIAGTALSFIFLVIYKISDWGLI